MTQAEKDREELIALLRSLLVLNQQNQLVIQRIKKKLKNMAKRKSKAQ